MTAKTFQSVNGFPPIEFMEDFQLVSQLRRKGKICILDAPALTSGRMKTL